MALKGKIGTGMRVLVRRTCVRKAHACVELLISDVACSSNEFLKEFLLLPGVGFGALCSVCFAAARLLC